MDTLPTPPSEDLAKFQGVKRQHSAGKPVKRVIKRTSTLARHSTPSPVTDSHSQHSDGRHKRVWKACERCRMKKTKCDGEFPCKRCKDDGLVCTAGTRKKTEYKQIPKGYAEVLENTQFVLVAAVHKLYSMVVNQQPWDLGEIELNDRGQPVVHNIASKLGCIRPNTDTDLPSVFPEDEAGLAELARQLEEQQQKELEAAALDKTSRTPDSATAAARIKSEKNPKTPAPIITTTTNNTNDTNNAYNPAVDRACSSSVASLDLSDFEPIDDDYRKAAFGTSTTSATLSPASLCYTDFDFPASTTVTSSPSHQLEAAAPCSSPSDCGGGGGFDSPIAPPPSTTTHPLAQQQYSSTYAWVNQSQPQYQYEGFLDASGDVVMMQQQQQQQLLESATTHFEAAMKPHLLAAVAAQGHGQQLHLHHQGVMLGLGDPMIYPGYDAEVLGL
ncbi:hypothetical protein VTK26DRAFT_2345 [Humicola hyalothermophila]